MDYALPVRLIIFFFCQQLKQIHIEFANRTGSSASILTTNDGCFLALRAKLTAFEFCVRGIMSYELLKRLFKI